MKQLKFLSLLSLAATLTACGGVKTTDSVFPAAIDACAESASQNRFIVHWEDGRYTIETDTSPEKFRSEFVSKNLHLIKHVDQDQRFQVRSLSEIQQMSSAQEQSDMLNWGPEAIDVSSVWDQGYEGQGIVIGVVDGMVDSSHTQLTNQILVNSGETPDNGVDDDGNGFVDDHKGVKVNPEPNDPVTNRHGTHVTGTIVADPSAGPVAGVAPQAKVVPAQFIANDGGGSIGDAIVALNYVAARGAKIINMSWGMNPCVDVPNLRSTLNELNNRGILLVTAAGNGDERGVGVNMDITPAYPSAYDFLNQINVAASTISQVLIGFSNYGVKKVHVAAPGVSIYSTTPENQIESMSGTSMAAPMVAGAAALLMQAVPSATAAQVKQALMNSVTRPSTPLNVKSGGIINVYDALNQLKSMTTP